MVYMFREWSDKLLVVQFTAQDPYRTRSYLCPRCVPSVPEVMQCRFLWPGAIYFLTI